MRNGLQCDKDMRDKQIEVLGAERRLLLEQVRLLEHEKTKLQHALDIGKMERKKAELQHML